MNCWFALLLQIGIFLKSLPGKSFPFFLNWALILHTWLQWKFQTSKSCLIYTYFLTVFGVIMLRFVISTLSTGTKVFLLPRRVPLLHVMVAFARPTFLFNNEKLTVLQATSVGQHFQICNYFFYVTAAKRPGVIIWIVQIWGLRVPEFWLFCVICCIAFRKLFYLTAFLLACNNGCHTCRGAASYGLICIY